MATLEQQHGADLQAVGLNKLVQVQSFDAEGKVRKAGPPQVIWYKTSLDVLKMAKEMQKLHHSSLVLSSWVRGAASLASARQPSSAPASVTLKHVCEFIWGPLMTDFFELGVSIANSSITFEQLHRVLVETGDQGDGELMKTELRVMSEMLSDSGRFRAEENWVERRLRQIQDYRQLQQAAAAAGAILRIAERMQLSGDFREIHTLSQLVTANSAHLLSSVFP